MQNVLLVIFHIQVQVCAILVKKANIPHLILKHVIVVQVELFLSLVNLNVVNALQEHIHIVVIHLARCALLELFHQNIQISAIYAQQGLFLI